MTQMLPRDLQESNERYYSRKHINGYLDQAIRDNPDSETKVHHGVDLLKAWLSQDYYESKNKRLAQLASLDIEQLVRQIFVGICYCNTPTLYVSITSQLATRLGFDDHRDSIQTIAEMVAVLCHTDAFDISKESAESSLMVLNKLTLPQALIDAASRSLYLPPMVCEPEDLTSNYHSPYLTHNETLILGKGNSHAKNICLDVINTQNKIALKLDLEFLTSLNEEPTHELDTAEKLSIWSQFARDSREVYLMLLKQGNKFWLTNRVDKRGRLYAQGYHVTTQGSPYKKAMIEFHKQEIVEGVPVCE